MRNSANANNEACSKNHSLSMLKDPNSKFHGSGGGTKLTSNVLSGGVHPILPSM